MQDYIILSDSTCDLSKDIREKYDIDYMLMTFSADGKTYNASLDWEDISSSDFYNSMRKGVLYKTTQIPMPTIIEKFTMYLEQGKDILYIGCSSALSGSVESSYIIRDKMKKNYPNNRVYCIDSLISGMGQGLMVIKAAQMRADGLSIEEVYNTIMDDRKYFSQCGTTGSLEYLKKSGRVKASEAFFGDLFAVKPIIISDTSGNNLAVKKIKGRKNALREVCDFSMKYIKDAENQTICIAHADAFDDAVAIKEMFNEKINSVKIELNVIGPIVGASVGPGTVAVYYHGSDKKNQMPEM